MGDVPGCLGVLCAPITRGLQQAPELAVNDGAALIWIAAADRWANAPELLQRPPESF